MYTRDLNFSMVKWTVMNSEAKKAKWKELSLEVEEFLVMQ